MTGREILTALTDIDEEYIEEAAKKHKSKKNIIIRFSAMAACLLIVAVGAFAAVKMIPRGKIKNSAIPNESYEEYDGNVADYDGDYSTIEKTDGTKANGSAKGNSASSSENETAYVKRWDEKTNTEKFREITVNGKEYYAVNTYVAADKVGQKVTKLTVLGKDVYTNSEYAAGAEIYEIKNISSECAAAVKYDGDEKYYVCRNAYYKPETLGQFINDLDLKNTLTFNEFNAAREKNGKMRDVKYTGADKERVWELLFSDTQAKAVKDIEALNFEMAVDISVDLKLLGYENFSLSVSRDGYILTNILDTAKAFYIGREAAEGFISYLDNSCKAVEYERDYSEPEYTGKESSGSTASGTASYEVKQ